MNRRIIVVGAGLIALVAFAIGAAFYEGETPPVGAGADLDTSGLTRPHSPVLGPAEAPVTITEFFDPSCEACRAFYPHVKAIMAKYPADVRVVLRYAAFHEGSDTVVKMLEAARLQGKFEPILEALLQFQPEWAVHGAPNLDRAWEIAKEAGLDVERAKTDAELPAIKAVLEQDMADIQTHEVESTPAFFVNGKPLGRFGPNELLELVSSEVESAVATQ